jgi:hypothetical protein
MALKYERLAMPVSERDAKLRELGLEINSELRDSQPMDAAEARVKGLLAEMLGDEIKQADDMLILKVIRAYWTYKNQLQTMADSLKQIIRWRKEKNIDTVLDGEVPNEEESMTAWPSFVYGQDYQGHVINCERIADINIETLVKADLQDVLLSRAKSAEMMDMIKADISEDIGCVRIKQIFILDLTGLVMSKHFSSKAREVMKPVFAQNDTMYPECLRTLYIVNSPFIFRTVWSIVKLWLDPMTVKKIVIVGGQSQYLPMFKKAGIPVNQLPEWCGGSHKGIGVYELCKEYRRNKQDAAAAGIGKVVGDASTEVVGAASSTLASDIGDVAADDQAAGEGAEDDSAPQQEQHPPPLANAAANATTEKANTAAALERDVFELCQTHCKSPLTGKQAASASSAAAKKAAAEAREKAKVAAAPAPVSSEKYVAASKTPVSVGDLELNLSTKGSGSAGAHDGSHHFSVDEGEEGAAAKKPCCCTIS